MGVYYPSAQLTLALRVISDAQSTDPLKENLTSSVSFAKIPSGLNPADAATRIAELNAELREVLADDVMDFGVAKAIREERDGIRTAQLIGEGSRLRAIEGGAPDTRFSRVGITPVRISVERNGFRVADTASITINWKDVPFDPRIVRAAGVECVLGTVAGSEFAKGYAGRKLPSGLPTSTMNTDPGQRLKGSFTNFVGWVDDWGLKHGDKADTVVLECRDYTALFLDTPMTPGDGIDLNKPFIEGIQAFIDQYPVVAGMPVIFGDVGEDPNADPPAPGQNIPPQNKSRKGKKAKRKRSGSQKMSLWDHITDVTVAFGFVPIVRGYQLRIIDPRTRLGALDTPAPRRMVFGRNLESLEFDRKLGGNKVPIVEVRAYDPTIGRVRWARWPTDTGQPKSGVGGITARPPKAFPNQPTPSGSVVDENVSIFTLDRAILGVGSLERLARQMFNQIGRQEIEGNFATKEVSSWNLNADRSFPTEDADLLDLRSGDPVELLVAPRDPRFPEETPNSTASIAALPARSREDYFVKQGLPQEVARNFARLQEAAAFQTVFRANNVRIEMDHAAGMSIKVDFINYITVHEDAIKDASPADVDEQVAATSVSQGMEDELGGDQSDQANQARDAQRRRRLTEKRRESGEATDRELNDATVAEKAALQSLPSNGGSSGRF